MDYDAIRTAVRQLCLLSTDDLSDTNLGIFVNDGLNKLAGMFDWPWLEAATTSTDITGGTANVDLPADFGRARAILVEGDPDKLAEISPDQAWERWGDDLPSGTPRVFWVVDSDIYVSPVPASNTGLKVHYWKTPTALSTGTDVPAFDARFHGALVDWALHRVWQREEDYVKSQRHRDAFVESVNDMVRFYFNRNKDYPLVFGEPSDWVQRRVPNVNMPFLDGA